MFVVHFIHIRGARAYEQTNNPLTAYSCKFLAFTTRADSAALLTNSTMLSVWCPSDSLSLYIHFIHQVSTDAQFEYKPSVVIRFIPITRQTNMNANKDDSDRRWVGKRMWKPNKWIFSKWNIGKKNNIILRKSLFMFNAHSPFYQLANATHAYLHRQRGVAMVWANTHIHVHTCDAWPPKIALYTSNATIRLEFECDLPYCWMSKNDKTTISMPIVSLQLSFYRSLSSIRFSSHAKNPERRIFTVPVNHDRKTTYASNR